MTKKVLIIEDDPGIVFMLTDRLTVEGYAVEHAQDGVKGEQKALDESYDVIILDVMLPSKDGFQICQTLRDKGINTPILMLTARSTNIDTVMGLKLGADDYLTKPFDMGILLARLEALTRRVQLQSDMDQPTDSNQQGIQFGKFFLNTQTQVLTQDNQITSLNTQEYRLLNYLVTNPERVLSRDDLLNAVWGYNSEVTTRTVDVHIAWLRKKLNDHPVARHIITLRGRGYKFILQPDV